MRRFILLLWAGLLAGGAWAVSIGDPAPDVAVPDSAGRATKLSDFKGKWVVLYFFPKAFTPGCTAESCSLRDGDADIQATGAVVLGASFDSVETQKKFREKHHLPFELLSDSDKKLARAFDSVAFAGLMAARKTYVIDPSGTVVFVFERVNTSAHSQEVLAKLKELQAAKK